MTAIPKPVFETIACFRSGSSPWSAPCIQIQPSRPWLASVRDPGVCWNAFTAKNKVQVCSTASSTPVFETISRFCSGSWQFAGKHDCSTGSAARQVLTSDWFYHWVWWGWGEDCGVGSGRKRINKRPHAWTVDGFYVHWRLSKLNRFCGFLRHVMLEVLMDTIFGSCVSTRPHTWNYGCTVFGFVRSLGEFFSGLQKPHPCR